MVQHKEKKVQFSKAIVFLSVIFSLIGIAAIICAVLFLGLSETVACVIIPILGGICSTSILFSLKKAQAENTIKLKAMIYETVSAVKIDYLDKTLALKQKYGEPVDVSMLDTNVEDDMDNLEYSALNDLEGSADNILSEATATIENNTSSNGYY